MGQRGRPQPYQDSSFFLRELSLSLIFAGPCDTHLQEFIQELSYDLNLNNTHWSYSEPLEVQLTGYTLE